MSILTKTTIIAALTLSSATAFAQSEPTALVGDPVAGAKKNSMCIGCHGIPEYKTAFPVLYRVPKIAGQTKEYMIASLQAYKTGERNHPTMRAISVTLSDQDMADLAAFYAQAPR